MNSNMIAKNVVEDKFKQASFFATLPSNEDEVVCVDDEEEDVDIDGDEEVASGKPVQLIVVDHALLSTLFGLRLGEAAARLKIGKTKLKRMCREFGIARWPRTRRNNGVENSEDLKDQDTLLSAFESQCTNSAGESSSVLGKRGRNCESSSSTSVEDLKKRLKLKQESKAQAATVLPVVRAQTYTPVMSTVTPTAESDKWSLISEVEDLVQQLSPQMTAAVPVAMPMEDLMLEDLMLASESESEGDAPSSPINSNTHTHKKRNCRRNRRSADQKRSIERLTAVLLAKLAKEKATPAAPPPAIFLEAEAMPMPDLDMELGFCRGERASSFCADAWMEHGITC